MSEPGPTWHPYADDRDRPIGTCGHPLVRTLDGSYRCPSRILKAGNAGVPVPCEGRLPEPSEPAPEKPDEFGEISPCARGHRRFEWETFLTTGCWTCETEEEAAS